LLDWQLPAEPMLFAELRRIACTIVCCPHELDWRLPAEAVSLMVCTLNRLIKQWQEGDFNTERTNVLAANTAEMLLLRSLGCCTHTIIFR
jgi:hypothetical protein